MTHDHRLETRNLGAGYEKRVILEDVSLSLPAGKITAIVGGNASGKSTLLRTLARILQPKSGAVLLDGQSVHQMKSRKLAQVMGLLPQSPIAPEGIAVADLVGRGRHPHQGLFSRWSAEDDRAVARALAATGTEELAERDLDTLSGGQRQRVWIAMALAQRPTCCCWMSQQPFWTSRIRSRCWTCLSISTPRRERRSSWYCMISTSPRAMPTT